MTHDDMTRHDTSNTLHDLLRGHALSLPVAVPTPVLARVVRLVVLVGGVHLHTWQGVDQTRTIKLNISLLH